MKAYRISNWNELAEVNSKGKPAKNSDKKLKKSKPMYVRWSFQGHNLDPRYKRLAKKAYTIGKMMEAACIGLWVLLMDMTKEFDDPQLRGWILDDLKRPIDAYQIAEHFEMRDKEHVAAAMELLCDPEIGLIEVADFGGIQGEKRGKKGKVAETVGIEGDFGKERSISLQNETETEYEENLKYETEIGETGGKAESGGSTAPASDLVSGSVSDISASVSDSVPRRGRYCVEEVRKLRQVALTELIGILPPRSAGDNTTYRDIIDHISGRMINETDEDLFAMMLNKVRRIKKHGLDNPRGAFVAAMKKSPFYYNPRGQVLIKGALDKYIGEKTR